MSPSTTTGKPDATRDNIERMVVDATAGEGTLLLAVSGGRDSMVMLELLARLAHGRIAAVATFDHGTGPHARQAVELVLRRARVLGLAAVSARSARPLRTEAELRRARWSFLRREARRSGTRVATAHTLDDHLETVVMRILRETGARGLAGLYADTGVARPLLEARRVDVAAWASAHALQWVEDPSNQSRGVLRNRVRLDLLPALAAARPTLPVELLSLSRRAAALRREVEAWVLNAVPHQVAEGTLIVAREPVLRYDAQELALLWPAMAARIGVTLDRRGTVRLAQFTIEAAAGSRIQLSGGTEVIRHRDEFRMRPQPSVVDGTEYLLSDGLRLGACRFRFDAGGEDLWTATLPADRRLRVRLWRPGDRMIPAGSRTPRRLKGLFRDAGVDASERRQWPVVLADEEIVWVPGVRRSSAATARPGRPEVRVVCDRLRS